MTFQLKAICSGLLIPILFWTSGCGNGKHVFREVKRPHELLSSNDLRQFIQIVKFLPEQRLTNLPSLFSNLPEWSASRELSVKGLVREESKQLGRRWLSDSAKLPYQQNRALKIALRRMQLSLDQFLGLADCIALTIAKTQIDEEEDLNQVIRTGRQEIALISQMDDVFSTLPSEEQYEVITKAAWLTRVDRAERLSSIPEENVNLIQENLDILTPLFPEEILTDPLAEVVDSRRKFGMPFEEMINTGHDSDLKWSKSNKNAHISHES